MTTSLAVYEVRPIAPEVLTELRRRDDAGREPVHSVDERGGSPLRCCLTRALPGAQIALLGYAPLRRWAAETGADPGPYDEVGPVFVHAEAADCPGAEPGPRYPVALHRGDRVLRAYDRRGRILRGVLVEPDDETDPGAPIADEVLSAMFSDPEVALVHVRAVGFGCFQHEVRRA
ncbi:DUF1203 domain-containing protein [Kitasatospora nipponensis]|uniref:DUF1203 domain-containing protein n=1 Tax=Kitasatospora nipponensis TaxID=258049 RepID=A0ABP4GMM6_9ACTN